MRIKHIGEMHLNNKDKIGEDTVILLKIDFAFKKVMKNEKVMRGFLSDVFDVSKEEIKEIQYIDTEMTKENSEEKLF